MTYDQLMTYLHDKREELTAHPERVFHGPLPKLTIESKLSDLRQRHHSIDDALKAEQIIRGAADFDPNYAIKLAERWYDQSRSNLDVRSIAGNKMVESRKRTRARILDEMGPLRTRHGALPGWQFGQPVEDSGRYPIPLHVFESTDDPLGEPFLD